MLSASDRLSAITHPLVQSMHMKKDFSYGNRFAEDVLVIETVFAKNGDDDEEFEAHLFDLLTDLKDIKDKAKDCVGPFDRVDIRMN